MLRRSIYLAGLALILMATASAPRADEVKTDLSKGGPTFQSGDNSLTIGGFAQFRYTGDSREQFDADTAGSGVGGNDGYSQQFAVQRIRLILSGGMFKPWLKYEFEWEFANTTGTNDNKVKDAAISVTKWNMATIKMGQFKTPFSLEEITSDTRLEFVDRSITDAKYAPSREQGFTLNGLTKDKKFGYNVGMFNGGGEAKPQDDQGLMYAGRAWWDPTGEYRLAESANDAPEKNIFHVGVAVRTGETQRGTATAGVFENPNNETAYNLELAWRYHRLFATGEYFLMADELQNPTVAPTVRSDGWHAQVGYMITPKNLEVALRYAEIDPDEDIVNDKVAEERVALGYYFIGHNLKVQVDGGRVSYGSAVSDPAYPGIALRGLPIPTGTRLAGIQHYTDSQYRLQMQLRF
ncbi:MAG TPA: porin [Verrucomicrobiae bacterium]|nr:porin [Verrucomicrobiae bacterium]